MNEAPRVSEKSHAGDDPWNPTLQKRRVEHHLFCPFFELSQHITAEDATLPAPAPCKNRKERATPGAYKFEATD